MTLSIRELVFRFKKIADEHPQINAFSAGPLYHLLEDIKYYPYLFVINDIPHEMTFSENNGYRSIEYSFILRVGDRVNNNVKSYEKTGGILSNNELDINSDTFSMLVDILNAISEDSLGLFSDLRLVDSIDIEPFFNEDSGDVNGHQATIKLRVKVESPCISPLTAPKH